MKHSHLFRHSTKWSELEHAIAALSGEKDRGDTFEEFCEAYLRLTPEYRFKEIWLQGRYPRWVIEKLCLTGQKDQGIDLVALTEDGKLWAIQAKFRSDRAATVSYRELSTFLGISDRADYRLIISNTRVLPSVVQRRGHCGEVLADRLDALDSNFFKQLAELTQGQKPEPVKPFTPKEHQRKAIQAAVKHFAKEDRGQLIMACGTGKTLASVWIAEHLNSKAILVMVPSLALMRQTVSVWAKNYRKAPFNYFCICSDDSVAHDIKSDYAVSHLWEMDIPVTTDPLEAGKFIRHHRGTPFIVFSTYQSSIVLSKAVSKAKDFRFDLIISDEAHRTAGMTKGLFNHVLDDRHIPSRKRLFMTATPRILAKHIVKRGMEEDVELFSMADETKYGREFYRVSFGDAIKRKLLKDYKVVIAVITDEELRQIVQQKAKVQVISQKTYEREAESLAKQVAYLKALKNYGIRHTISYHSRVAFAQSFSSSDNACGIQAVNQLVKLQKQDSPELQAFHVNGTMPAGERSSILKDFAEASFSVVSNARCLTEGVDIPSVDGVLFFDPKYRLTDIVQATGRAIRLHPGKEYGYLIVPVFIKEDEDVETALESSDFSQVWSVIKAMQSQDERLDEVISKLRTLDGEIKGGNKELSSTRESTEEKLFETVRIFNVPKKISAKKFVQAVETQVLENIGRSWDYWYGLLLEFRKKHPKRWPAAREEFPQGNSLGQWCDVQRSLEKVGSLSRERRSKLRHIQFEFYPREEAWQYGFQMLREYKKKFLYRWPSEKEMYKGFKLGQWCKMRRIQKEQGSISRERISALDGIAFPWNPRDFAWNFAFTLLKTFRERNPNRWPRAYESFQGFKIGGWCVHQKQLNKKNSMSAEKLKKLISIHFPFALQQAVHRELWMTLFELLKLFRKKNPHEWPQRSTIFKREKLGIWCDIQRRKKKELSLSKEKINALNSMDFPWSLFDKHFEDKLIVLKKFRKKNPSGWPGRSEENEKNNLLGNWCNNLRAARRKGVLSREKIKRLNEIHFEWTPSDKVEAFWKTHYAALKEFKAKNPDMWPKQQKKYRGLSLGAWCNTQKTRKVRGLLSAQQIRLLNRLHFPWNQREEKWCKNLKLLKLYFSKYKKWPQNTSVFGNTKLGNWCKEQRGIYRQKKMSAERISLLEKIGFDLSMFGDGSKKSCEKKHARRNL